MKFYRYQKGTEFQQHSVFTNRMISEFTILMHIGSDEDLKGKSTKFQLKNKRLKLNIKEVEYVRIRHENIVYKQEKLF